jgi:hypothetical protein
MLCKQDFVDDNGGDSDLMRTRADLVAAAVTIVRDNTVMPDYFESFSLKQLRVSNDAEHNIAVGRG